jgi:hypothetical protein
MKFIILSMLILAGSDKHSAPERIEQYFQYDDIVETAMYSHKNKGGVFLRGCVSGWSSTKLMSKRINALSSRREALLNASKSFAMIEIGNSSYPEYSFAFLGDKAMRSLKSEQQRVDFDIGSIIAGKPLSTIQTVNIDNNVSDGSCYFVSIRDRGEIKRFAYYGMLTDDSDAAHVIRHLLGLMAP